MRRSSSWAGLRCVLRLLLDVAEFFSGLFGAGNVGDGFEVYPGGFKVAVAVEEAGEAPAPGECFPKCLAPDAQGCGIGDDAREAHAGVAPMAVSACFLRCGVQHGVSR